jgi:hypothetical protein
VQFTLSYIQAPHQIVGSAQLDYIPTVGKLFSEMCPPDQLDKVIIYLVDRDQNHLVFGPRFISEDILFIVDLYYKFVFCHRCRQRTDIKVESVTKGQVTCLPQLTDVLLYQLREQHMDCSRHLCWN